MPKDPNKKSWESSDVPALCEDCLGSNPYVRMTRERYGQECKLCLRPFTVFRWKQEKGARPRSTVICQSCSRQKNACQSCMLDLTYGLPLAIRDAALKMADEAPMSSNVITKQYIAQNLDKMSEGTIPDLTAQTDQAARNLLQRLATSKPYYRGPSSDGGANKQNDAPPQSLIEDVNRIIAKLPLNGTISRPPKDETITSFFVAGVEDDLADYAVREYFGQFGKIKSVFLVHMARCGYVTFELRTNAETAAESLKKSGGRFVVKGCRLKATWGKPRPLGTNRQEHLRIGQIVKRSMNSHGRKTASNAMTSAEWGTTVETKSLPPPSSKAEISYEAQRAGYEG
jgi:pre-mRNA-splicing factor RBM22/SLT11